jgi:AraC-like DNA-binding protein
MAATHRLALDVTSGADWLGRARVDAGIALFVGRSGDNRPHRHLAHQICVVPSGRSLRLELDHGIVEGGALWVRAGARHRLLDHDGLLLWVDPTHPLAATLVDDAGAAWGPLDGGWARRLRGMAAAPDPIALSSRMGSKAFADESRLVAVIAALRQGIARGDAVDRGTLASLCGLSPDRFSHWFSESTGIPLRSYRKWLRLLIAVDQVLAGRPLSEAAHGAGFSDQAHFARSLRAMVGITASALQRGVRAA